MALALATHHMPNKPAGHWSLSNVWCLIAAKREPAEAYPPCIQVQRLGTIKGAWYHGIFRRKLSALLQACSGYHHPQRQRVWLGLQGRVPQTMTTTIPPCCVLEHTESPIFRPCIRLWGPRASGLERICSRPAWVRLFFEGLVATS